MGSSTVLNLFLSSEPLNSSEKETALISGKMTCRTRHLPTRIIFSVWNRSNSVHKYGDLAKKNTFFTECLTVADSEEPHVRYLNGFWISLWLAVLVSLEWKLYLKIPMFKFIKRLYWHANKFFVFYFQKQSLIYCKHLLNTKSSTHFQVSICFSWLTRHEIQKPINMESSILKCANADLRISLYACVHIKAIPWKFRFLNPRSPWVVGLWSL